MFNFFTFLFYRHFPGPFSALKNNLALLHRAASAHPSIYFTWRRTDAACLLRLFSSHGYYRHFCFCVSRPLWHCSQPLIVLRPESCAARPHQARPAVYNTHVRACVARHATQLFSSLSEPLWDHKHQLIHPQKPNHCTGRHPISHVVASHQTTSLLHCQHIKKYVRCTAAAQLTGQHMTMLDLASHLARCHAAQTLLFLLSDIMNDANPFFFPFVKFSRFSLGT